MGLLMFIFGVILFHGRSMKYLYIYLFYLLTKFWVINNSFNHLLISSSFSSISSRHLHSQTLWARDLKQSLVTNSLDGTLVRSWQQEFHHILVVCGTATIKKHNIMDSKIPKLLLSKVIYPWIIKNAYLISPTRDILFFSSIFLLQCLDKIFTLPLFSI